MKYTKDKIVQAVTVNRELTQLLRDEQMTPDMIDLIQDLVKSQKKLGLVIITSLLRLKSSLTPNTPTNE